MELIRRYQKERATLNAEIDSVLGEITAKLGGAI
jgi:type I restriction enzyme M protein